jgi:hypothetical protein
MSYWSFRPHGCLPYATIRVHGVTYFVPATPERDVTVDESILLCKGGHGWMQYIPQKRARFGIDMHAV